MRKMLDLTTLIAAFALGYALGSIPFGLILTKLAGTQDLRSIGSGNIGATNVLRTGRKGLAAATLLGDMLKGTAAVLLVEALWGRDHAMLAALGLAHTRQGKTKNHAPTKKPARRRAVKSKENLKYLKN